MYAGTVHHRPEGLMFVELQQQFAHPQNPPNAWKLDRYSKKGNQVYLFSRVIGYDNNDCGYGGWAYATDLIAVVNRAGLVVQYHETLDCWDY